MYFTCGLCVRGSFFSKGVWFGTGTVEVFSLIRFPTTYLFFLMIISYMIHRLWWSHDASSCNSLDNKRADFVYYNICVKKNSGMGFSKFFEQDTSMASYREIKKINKFRKIRKTHCWEYFPKNLQKNQKTWWFSVFFNFVQKHVKKRKQTKCLGPEKQEADWALWGREM